MKYIWLYIQFYLKDDLQGKNMCIFHRIESGWTTCSPRREFMLSCEFVIHHLTISGASGVWIYVTTRICVLLHKIRYMYHIYVLAQGERHARREGKQILDRGDSLLLRLWADAQAPACQGCRWVFKFQWDEQDCQSLTVIGFPKHHNPHVSGLGWALVFCIIISMTRFYDDTGEEFGQRKKIVKNWTKTVIWRVGPDITRPLLFT